MNKSALMICYLILAYCSSNISFAKTDFSQCIFNSDIQESFFSSIYIASEYDFLTDNDVSTLLVKFYSFSEEDEYIEVYKGINLAEHFGQSSLRNFENLIAYSFLQKSKNSESVFVTNFFRNTDGMYYEYKAKLDEFQKSIPNIKNLSCKAVNKKMGSE